VIAEIRAKTVKGSALNIKQASHRDGFSRTVYVSDGKERFEALTCEYKVLCEKLKQSEEKRKLLATANASLLETNTGHTK